MRTSLASLVLLLAIATTWGAMPAGTNAAGAGAPTALLAVQVITKPLLGHMIRRSCDTVRGTLSGCPMTDRFRRAIDLKTRKVNANLVCRCQNIASKVTYRVMSNNGKKAGVNVAFFFGSKLAYTITFVTIHKMTGWYVSDEYCAGRPATSIYRNVGPCS